MKNTILSVFLALLFIGSLSAQDAPVAKKHDNPQWKWVVYVDFHSGKANRAYEIIDNYFSKATQKAGTSRPAMVLKMETGEADMIIVWDIAGGIEELNWDLTPNNVKWQKALVEIAGGQEKAKALRKEYASLIRTSKRELALADQGL